MNVLFCTVFFAFYRTLEGRIFFINHHASCKAHSFVKFPFPQDLPDSDLFLDYERTIPNCGHLRCCHVISKPSKKIYIEQLAYCRAQIIYDHGEYFSLIVWKTDLSPSNNLWILHSANYSWFVSHN